MTLNPSHKAIEMSNVVQLVTIEYVSGNNDVFENAEVSYVPGGVVIGYKSRKDHPNQWMTYYVPNNLIAHVMTSA